MLTSPWDLVLTLLFAATGLWCAIDLVMHRDRVRGADGTVTEHAIIHFTHLVMSAAMIVMVWVPVIDAVTWAQVAVFAIFSFALVPGVLASGSAATRISLIGHIALNAAMIWMLLAMPLLMAGMSSGEGESSGHHHGGGSGVMLTSTPVWVDVVNVFFVVVSAAAAVWWVVALLRQRGRHLHDICYAAMAAGMAIMLVVMNA